VRQAAHHRAGLVGRLVDQALRQRRAAAAAGVGEADVPAGGLQQTDGGAADVRLGVGGEGVREPVHVPCGAGPALRQLRFWSRPTSEPADEVLPLEARQPAPVRDADGALGHLAQQGDPTGRFDSGAVAEPSC
jgi:hypothetical protein